MTEAQPTNKELRDEIRSTHTKVILILGFTVGSYILNILGMI